MKRFTYLIAAVCLLAVFSLVYKLASDTAAKENAATEQVENTQSYSSTGGYSPAAAAGLILFFGLFFWGWHLKTLNLHKACKENIAYEGKLQFLDKLMKNFKTREPGGPLPRTYKEPINRKHILKI